MALPGVSTGSFRPLIMQERALDQQSELAKKAREQALLLSLLQGGIQLGGMGLSAYNASADREQRAAEAEANRAQTMRILGITREQHLADRKEKRAYDKQLDELARRRTLEDQAHLESRQDSLAALRHSQELAAIADERRYTEGQNAILRDYQLADDDIRYQRDIDKILLEDSLKTPTSQDERDAFRAEWAMRAADDAADVLAAGGTIEQARQAHAMRMYGAQQADPQLFAEVFPTYDVSQMTLPSPTAQAQAPAAEPAPAPYELSAPEKPEAFPGPRRAMERLGGGIMDTVRSFPYIITGTPVPEKPLNIPPPPKMPALQPVAPNPVPQPPVAPPAPQSFIGPRPSPVPATIDSAAAMGVPPQVLRVMAAQRLQRERLMQ